MAFRAIVAVVAVLSIQLSHHGAAWSNPITLVPGTVNMFRDTRGLNDVGLGQGDLFQFGADIQGGAAGSSLGATYPPTGLTLAATACAPLAVNANFCARTAAFSSTRLAEPWSFTFTNGPDQLVQAGPTLMDNNGAILNAVPFPVSVRFSRGATPTTPRISWEIPQGFVPDAFRINIFDKNERRLGNGQADIIHSVAIPPASTSYTIPATLNNSLGRSLAVGGQYSINFQLIETRNHVPLANNNNALILRRSSSFFSFTPTNTGGPNDVHLPQVGPDPNPNDNLGAPYLFSVGSVGPAFVTFVDPVIAVGYDYAIGTGDPNFASVILPDVGDGIYDVIVGGVHKTVMAGEQFFFPEGGVAAFSVRGIEESARLDPGNVNAFVTGLTFVAAGSFTGTMTPVLTSVPDGPRVTALGPAKVWVGLRNSDDAGLRLDLKAEVFVNDVDTDPIGTGQLDNVSGRSSGFGNAGLYAIPIALVGDAVTLGPDDELVLQLSVRRTCTGGGHVSGTARLWYSGPAIDSGRARDAGSRFDATIDGAGVTYYLHTASELDTTPGVSRAFIDAPVNSKATCPGRPFVRVGDPWRTSGSD